MAVNCRETPAVFVSRNPAVMEFGARCTARKPCCEPCPLRATCAARQKIAGDLAELLRATKKEPTYRYEGSNRFYRGRVLAKLREASDKGAELRSLGVELREGFTDEDVCWIYGIMRSLEKSGLAAVCGKRPAYAAEDIAEDRPAYGASEERDEPGETRVRLP